MSEGVKYDAGKPPLGLIARSALEAEAQVMAFGAQKYGRDNWRQGIAWSRLADAALRHIVAFIDGDDIDQETGISHLAHARCCLAFLIEYQKTHPELDDRHGSKAREHVHKLDTQTSSEGIALREDVQPVQQRDTRRVVLGKPV